MLSVIILTMRQMLVVHHKWLRYWLFWPVFCS